MLRKGRCGVKGSICEGVIRIRITVVRKMEGKGGKGRNEICFDSVEETFENLRAMSF